ncbi:pyridoxal phosphate-dependent aminotransferase [Sphingomonas sp. C3-2]|uniref:pyridoxal phosphate-dependent aminotransferase n=1 Tax=Sphingomonas sp. C3-2 TaxID=3062169 RepID=UPI00294AA797|nr:aminotransferase class I/II-fold pyridoxal phosphate-dependent enzyme [Sphingomonas sp. C3-2]WOK35431.1 aminotransferase class I/II-fold pyridoxal phosphate-dependent enzyme [Sphingomonas sp. C3-2]
MVAQVDPFYAIGLSRLAHQLKADGLDIIHMEFGQPSTGAPQAAIAAAHSILDSDPMGYWESTALKERIARHYAESHGVAVDPEQVILTCGASPALVLALNTALPTGARVALARPGYVAYRNNLKALHMEPVEITCGPAERYQLTAAAIAAIEPAPDAVIIASPANPTGTIIAEGELRAIAAICAERGIRIISDEIYHGLSYTGAAHSMLEFAPDAFIINSFSKYFSMAAWRLGWLIAPLDQVDPVRARMTNLFLTPPSLSQHAGLIAFDCRDELEGHVDTYRRNRALLLDALPGLGLNAIAPPDGAFYIYADIGHLTQDSLAFCEKLLRETGVATAPGVDFDPVEGHHFMRISFAVSTPLVEQALVRLAEWFPKQPRLA